MTRWEARRTCPYRAVYRSALTAFFMLVGLVLSCPDSGLATDLPVYGGLGGNEFREECPKESYLVGLAGRTGAWVDRIAPVCAPWLRGSQNLDGGKKWGHCEFSERATNWYQSMQHAWVSGLFSLRIQGAHE